MDGGYAALIPDESQPSAFSIHPEAAAMDAAAIIAMVSLTSRSPGMDGWIGGVWGHNCPQRWGFQRG